MSKSKSSEDLSLGKEVEIHGIIVKKMPCGKYFKAIQKLKELPTEFVKEISNNKEIKLSEIFDLENLLNIIAQLAIVTPKFLFNFLGELLEVDKKKLENELTPTELIEVCKKFWEVNDLENFFNQLEPIISKILTLIGSKEQ